MQRVPRLDSLSGPEGLHILSSSGEREAAREGAINPLVSRKLFSNIFSPFSAQLEGS